MNEYTVIDMQKQIQNSIQEMLQSVYNFSAGDVDKLFIYSFMGSDAFQSEYAFQYDDKIVERQNIPNRESKAQIPVGRLIVNESRKIREAYKIAGQEFPNELYLTYDVKTKRMSAQFKYDVEWDESAKIPTPDQHFEEWMKNIQQGIENQ